MPFVKVTRERLAAIFDAVGVTDVYAAKFLLAVFPYARECQFLDDRSIKVLASMGYTDSGGLYVSLSNRQLAELMGANDLSAAKRARAHAVRSGLAEVLHPGTRGYPTIYRLFPEKGGTLTCNRAPLTAPKGGTLTRNNAPLIVENSENREGTDGKGGDFSSLGGHVNPNRGAPSHVTMPPPKNLPIEIPIDNVLVTGARGSASSGDAPRATVEPVCRACGSGMFVETSYGITTAVCMNRECSEYNNPKAIREGGEDGQGSQVR